MGWAQRGSGPPARDTRGTLVRRLGAAEYVENIRAREAEFEALAQDKSAAHGSSRDATRSINLAAKRWDAAMRALVNYLDDVYDDAVAGQKSERQYLLQPLADANAVARTRAARGEADPADPAAPAAGGSPK